MCVCLIFFFKKKKKILQAIVAQANSRVETVAIYVEMRYARAYNNIQEKNE